MSATLMLHQGGQEVSREQLTQYILPPATRTWKPISHVTVLDTALRTLEEAGYTVSKTRLGVARDSQRFFGLCQAWHKPNCAEFPIMRRLDDSAGKNAAGTRVGGLHNLAPIPGVDGSVDLPNSA